MKAKQVSIKYKVYYVNEKLNLLVWIMFLNKFEIAFVIFVTVISPMRVGWVTQPILIDKK